MKMEQILLWTLTHFVKLKSIQKLAPLFYKKFSDCKRLSYTQTFADLKTCFRHTSVLMRWSVLTRQRWRKLQQKSHHIQQQTCITSWQDLERTWAKKRVCWRPFNSLKSDQLWVKGKLSVATLAEYKPQFILLYRKAANQDGAPEGLMTKKGPKDAWEQLFTGVALS